MKTRRYSLYQYIDNHIHSADQEFDPIKYSLFKHGSVDHICQFAQDLSNLIDLNEGRSDRTIITGSAYYALPSASNLMLERMMSNHLSQQQYHACRLVRNQIFPFDYARLGEVDRQHHMNTISIKFDRELIRGEKVVIVDDAYVSGAHERAILRCLGDFPREVNFYYLLDLSNHPDSSIETEMNHSLVRCLNDLLPIFAHPLFRINSRVLKMIWSAHLEEFKAFMACLPENRTAGLFEMANQEGFHEFGPNYQAKFLANSSYFTVS